MNVVAAFTQLDGPGGVQRFGRFMAIALADYCQKIGANIQIFSLLDSDGIIEGFSYKGCNGSRLGLVRRACIAASGSRLIVLGHPNLTPIALLSPGCASLIHAHGIDVWSPLRWIERLALQRATLVTTSSLHTAECVSRIQRRYRQVEVLHPPVRLPIQTSSLAGDYFLAVSRLNPEDNEKGVDRLIDIYQSRSLSLPLRIVGDGRDSLRLRERAKGLSNVEFLGRVSDEELFRLYTGCRAFVLPSTKEGFGMVYAEAMAHGKPAIGLDSGGVSDVIKEGVTGFLVPVGAETLLVERLQSLASDADLAARLGAQARAFVSEHFSESVFRARLHGHLDAMVKELA